MLTTLLALLMVDIQLRLLRWQRANRELLNRVRQIALVNLNSRHECNRPEVTNHLIYSFQILRRREERRKVQEVLRF
jgi:hypothetical protein